MRAAVALLLAAAPLAAQEVAECDPVPPVTALIEPWEATTASLAGGAVRIAVIEGAQGTRRLMVLVLPPPDEAARPAPAEGEGAEAVASDPAAPPPRRSCRIVSDGGLGFADLDLARLDSEEDAAAGTLVLRLPALHFVPESTELAEETLTVTLGVADGTLAATVGE